MKIVNNFAANIHQGQLSKWSPRRSGTYCPGFCEHHWRAQYKI